jgi:GNAT superfamily N-acetyltransferase
MDESSLDIVIRDFDPDIDQAYIYASWRNSSYYSSINPNESIPPKAFFSFKTAAIKKTLKEAEIRIACLKEAPAVIIGYSVITNKHLDFVYVKSDYRNQGIGTLLVPKDIETVTSELTKIGKVIALKKNLKEK